MSVACVRASVALSVSYLLDTGDPEGPFFMVKGAETNRSCDLTILRFMYRVHLLRCEQSQSNARLFMKERSTASAEICPARY